MSTHYDILIIGAGTAGIMTSALIKKQDKNKSIAILDPAETHYYQPAWTLVGAGTYDFQKTARPMTSVIPKGVKWIKGKAINIRPDDNQVDTESHGSITYQALIVAPGLVMEPSMIEGLPEAMERNVVVSNYTDPDETWKQIQKIDGGNALFTQPATPIKCGGAPQKTMYLASDFLRKKGRLDKTNVIFATPGTVIFGVPEIRKTLEKVLKRYDVIFKTYYKPVKIDSDKKIAYFEYTKKDENQNVLHISPNESIGEKINDKSIVEIPFDFLHLAPPQAAPKFIRDNKLSDESGWLIVDHHSMVHEEYDNVFGLGDVAALPTAKTGAAIRKQAPVVADNVLSYLAGKGVVNTSYDGYSSCPLVTAYGKMVLAEFDYDNKFTPDPKLKQMLVFDSSKEHWRLWMLKKYGLPYLYWNKMLKGVKV